MSFRIKRLFITTILTCMVVALLAPGCGQSSPETVSEPAETTPEQAPETSIEECGDGVLVDLSLSDFPAVNQTVKLTFTLETMIDTGASTKVWIEFERYDPALWYPLGRSDYKDRIFKRLAEKFDSSDPSDVRLKELAALQPESDVPQEAVVVDGELNWEGPLNNGDRVELSGTIRFPEEGEWLITAWWHPVEWDGPYVRDSLRLTVTEDSGWFGWQRDYSNIGATRVQELYPVDVLIKPSRAPLLGEPFEVSLWIRSIRDVDQAEVFLNVYRRVGTLLVSGGFLSEGDFHWRGSLKKGVPVQVSGNITFLEEGDWRIGAWSRGSPDLNWGNMHNISLHVGKEESRFGWTESHKSEHIAPPPPGISEEPGNE